MRSNKAIRNRSGFTLIEVLVTLILLAVLAAAVFPVVTQQSAEADPVRAANDLGSIRSAVESFRLNVRPEFPGDLEDLAFAPATTVEASVDGTVYGTSLPSEWNGPYLDVALTTAAGAQQTGHAFETAFGGDVQNDLVCVLATGVPIANQAACTQGTHSVGAKVTGWSLDQFNEIDALVDGTASATTGKLRFVDLDTSGTPETAVYIVAPYF